MNTSERPEASRETDHVRERRATPSAHTAPQEHRSERRAFPRNAAAPHAPDEGAFETYVGGAGI